MLFDFAQTVFGLMFFSAIFSGQAVVFANATNGFDGVRQVAFSLEAFGAEAGELFFETDDVLFIAGRQPARGPMRPSADVLQTGQSSVKAAEPFADGFGRGAIAGGSGFDAEALGVLHHSQA